MLVHTIKSFTVRNSTSGSTIAFLYGLQRVTDSHFSTPGYSQVRSTHTKVVHSYEMTFDRICKGRVRNLILRVQIFSYVFAASILSFRPVLNGL